MVHSQRLIDDEITTVNQENMPVELVASITHQRVQHYGDVVEFIVSTEIARCQSEDKFTPSKKQIDFLRKEVVRYAVIRRDIETAQKLKIKNNGNLLNETPHSMDTRT